MLHNCDSELGQHWFMYWLVTCSAQSYHLNQRWLIDNWTLGNKLWWNSHWHSIIFIQKNASGNVICEMATILSRRRWVKLTETLWEEVVYGFAVPWPTCSKDTRMYESWVNISSGSYWNHHSLASHKSIISFNQALSLRPWDFKVSTPS